MQAWCWLFIVFLQTSLYSKFRDMICHFLQQIYAVCSVLPSWSMAAYPLTTGYYPSPTRQPKKLQICCNKWQIRYEKLRICKKSCKSALRKTQPHDEDTLVSSVNTLEHCACNVVISWFWDVLELRILILGVLDFKIILILGCILFENLDSGLCVTWERLQLIYITFSRFFARVDSFQHISAAAGRGFPRRLDGRHNKPESKGANVLATVLSKIA